MEGFVLKILSGQQSGAEVLLSPGEYSLGSSEEDDLQFDDLSLHAGHARLRVQADAVEIRAEAGGVLSGNGLELEAGDGQWRELEPLDIISIGMTRFAIGAATANWASIVDALKPGGDRTEAQQDDAAASNERAIAAWLARIRALPRQFWLGAAGLFLVVAVAAWFITGGDTTRRVLVHSDPEADLAAVHEAVARLTFRHAVEVRREVDDSIYVEGYVGSLAERRAVVNAIDKTGVQVGIRIWVVEVLRNGLASLLESTGYELDYEVTDRGVLILRGVVLDKAAADRLLKLVEEQVLGFSRIEASIRTAEDLLAEVQALAKRARIDETVLLRLDGTLIEASGLIAADQIDLWAGFVSSYVRNYAGIIPMRSHVQIARNDGSPERLATPVDDTGRAYGVELSDGSRMYGHEDHLVRHVEAVEGKMEAAAEASSPVPPRILRPATTASPEIMLASPVPPGEDRPMQSWRGAAPDPVLILLLKEEGKRTDHAVGPRQELLERFSELSRFGPIRPKEERANPATAFLLLFGKPEEPGKNLERTVTEILPDRGIFAAANLVGNEEEQAGTPQAPDARQAREREPLPQTREQEVARPRETVDIAPASLPKPAEPMRQRLMGDTQIAGFLGSIAPASAAPACRQVHALPVATEADALDLTDLTVRLLSAWRNGKLSNVALSEGMAELAESLELIARVRREAALQAGKADPEPFADLAACPKVQSQCWPGSKLNRANLPSVMVWLDVLAISESTSLAMFQPHNQALILEAGLNPRRVARCAQGLAGAVPAAMSIYIADSVRNPGIINAVAGRLDRFAISISGANLVGERYVQTVEGEKLREGAAPTADSRLLHVGELGSYFRTARGLAIAIYDPRMSWFHDG